MLAGLLASSPPVIAFEDRHPNMENGVYEDQGEQPKRMVPHRLSLSDVCDKCM